MGIDYPPRAPLAPHFVSVTYGAGGSTRERTHATVARMVAETALTPAAHLTCVAATKDEVDDVVRAYWEAGVRHIVALRGDPLGGLGAIFSPHPGGYETSTALIAGIRRIADFEISVSAYPEKTSGEPVDRSRHRCLESQGRCRRNARHHAILLRERTLSALCRACAPAWNRYSDRARSIAPVQNFKQMANFARKTGSWRARMARRPFRRPRRRCDDTAPRRCCRRRRASARSRRSRDHGVPFLYDEPRRSHVYVRSAIFSACGRERAYHVPSQELLAKAEVS